MGIPYCGNVMVQKKFLADEIQIRWLIRRDMDEVLAIEKSNFECPWDEMDFLTCLRQRNCIGTVAEFQHEIYGFMIYELHKNKLRILNFAVHKSFQRQGIGSRLVQRLIDKLSQQRRREVVLEIRDGNLDGQLFFQHHGFRAVSVLRRHYRDTNEDAYYMRYCLPGCEASTEIVETASEWS